MRLHRPALLAGLAVFVAALLASPASHAQTIVRCRTTGGSLVDCTTPLLNTYINWGSPSAIGGTAPAAVTGTTITATTQFSGPATGLTGIPGGQITGSLSGVTINCSSNTCSNILLTAAVTGVLPMANGGTGSSTGDLVATNYLTAPWLKLNSIASPGTPSLGQVWINSTTANGLDQLFLHTSDGEDTILGVGSVVVRNTSGSTITRGQAVYISGSTGNVPTVALARANAVSTSSAYCIALSSISNGSYGRCMRAGVLTSVDTSSFSSGDSLWVSSSTAGALQNTDPAWPAYSNRIGMVLVSGISTGSIAVTASPTYTGQGTGTTSSSWTTGPGSGSSAVTHVFANANSGTLTWTPTSSRTLTLPDVTDTVATISASQILTNKTLNCANNTCTVRLGSDVTGTLPEANGGFASDISGIGTGLVARTAANTYAARTITAPAAGITVSNGGGGSGNPTLALANDLAAVEGLSTNGCAARTATYTWTTRTVTAGTGISVTNGDCTAGNPTIAVDTATVVTLTGTQTLTNKTPRTR